MTLALYPAPPVTPNTFQPAPETLTDQGLGGTLATTGAGFNVGLLLLVALLLIAVGLIVWGATNLRRNQG
jgi:hypothetical protein